MTEVFISYAREDRDRAEELYRNLRSEGFDAWIDSHDLLPGAHWKSEIRRIVRAAQYMVILLSERSMTKRGFFHSEIRDALDVVRDLPENEIFLIPARLEPCEPSHEDLRDLNRVDLFPDWDHGVAKIAKTLRRRNLDPGPDIQKVQESNPTARLRGDTIGLPGRKSRPLALIATTREALYEMAQRLAAGDVKGLFNVVKEERGTLIAAGTLVEIIEWLDFRELKIARIKVLEGQLKGYIVWTPSLCLP